MFYMWTELLSVLSLHLRWKGSSKSPWILLSAAEQGHGPSLLVHRCAWGHQPMGCSHPLNIAYCNEELGVKWEMQERESSSGFLGRVRENLHQKSHFTELLLYLNHKISLVSWIICSVPVQTTSHVLVLQRTSLKHMIEAAARPTGLMIMEPAVHTFIHLIPHHIRLLLILLPTA